MRGELRYAYSKIFSRLAWIAFWIVFLGFLIYGLYQAASTMQLRSLPTGQIQLIVPYSKYIVGETVTFTVKNNYNSPISLTNGCPSEPLNVYRLENGSWVRIHDTAAINECPKENRQIVIAANSSVSGSFAPWHHLFNTPGRYRVVAYVEYYDALPYQDFEVIAKYIPVPKPVVPIIRTQITTTPVRSEPSTPTPTTTTTTTYTEPADD